MGNLIYPTLPGRSFPSGRAVLPPKVRIRTTPSDREFRSRDSLLPRYQYSVAYEWLRKRASSPELQTLVGFYNQVGGPFDSFLYLDPDDNTASGQLFATGDGTATQFQLLRSFGGFAELVSNTVGQPEVFIDGLQACNALAPAGSFETDSNADGLADGWARYSLGSVGTLSQNISTDAWALSHGAKAQYLAAASLGSTINDRQGINKAAIPAQHLAGLAVSMSAYVNGSVNSSAVIEMSFHNSSGTQIGYQYSTTVLSGLLQRISVAETAPASTVYINVGIWQHSNTGASPRFYVDAAQLAAGAALRPFSNNLAIVNTVTGLVTFTTAPAAAAPLSWAGQFYRRCRFMGDKLDTEKFMSDLFSAKRVEFISTKA